jgi:hypothetical protein
MKKIADLLRWTLKALLYGLKPFLKTSCIKELFQLFVKDFKLLFETLGVATISDSVNDILTGFQVTRIGTSM